MSQEENVRLPRAAREKTSLEFPRALRAALDGLLESLEESGERTSMAEVIAALIFDALHKDPDVLRAVLRAYRRARVSDVSQYHPKVVSIRPGRPRANTAG